MNIRTRVARGAVSVGLNAVAVVNERNTKSKKFRGPSEGS